MTENSPGRPSIRHADLDERIIRKLNEGCSFRWFDSPEAVGYPSTATIRRWRQEDEEFDARCVRACESHAEAEYERMEELEEQLLAGDVDAKAGSVVLSNMRWRMEKRKARTFGQRVEVKGTMTLEQLVAASAPEVVPE